MSVIITDSDFTPVAGQNLPVIGELDQGITMVDLFHGDDLDLLRPYLGQMKLIRLNFAAFNDGRAFTVARRLRLMGYDGVLRACGPVISDQYAMLRRVGFDEVEISDDLAARQPQAEWQFRAGWQDHDYQARLRG